MTMAYFFESSSIICSQLQLNHSRLPLLNSTHKPSNLTTFLAYSSAASSSRGHPTFCRQLLFPPGNSESGTVAVPKPTHKPRTRQSLEGAVRTAESYSSSAFSCGTKHRTIGGLLLRCSSSSSSSSNCGINEKKKKRRVFFLDVNPLCYKGSTPSLHSFAHWISLFFSQVSHSDPVIAVIDGEKGNEYRRKLLPSYKANRRKYVSKSSGLQRMSKGYVERSHQVIADVLRKCNVPVVKVEAFEADDVVASLVRQVLERGFRVVIASPDKDFKQLISEDVQIVLPIPKFDRWSFYTVKHYMAQYNCDPCSDLSLRCIMGDEVDGVPGIQQMVPGFGRKTALKLLKKHGSLQNLLNAAAVRTVGKNYAQDALTNYADFLRRNYEVLSLKRDIDVNFQEEWFCKRDACNDLVILSNFQKFLQGLEEQDNQNRLHSND